MRKLLLLFLLTITFTSCTKEDISSESGWYEYSVDYCIQTKLSNGAHTNCSMRNGKNYFYFNGSKITKWIRSIGPAFGNRHYTEKDSHKILYSNENSCVNPDKPFNFNFLSSATDGFLTVSGEEISIIPCDECASLDGYLANQHVNDGVVTAVKVDIDECSMINYYQNGL